MKPNLALVEGIHGVAWDAQAVECRLERLLATIRKLDPVDELHLAQLVQAVDKALQDAQALVDELLEQVELPEELAGRHAGA